MSRRIRTIWLVALLVLAPFSIGCGGAEEPAAAPVAEEPAADPQPEPEPEPTPVEEPQPEEPQEPQLVGDIIISDDGFDWTTTTAENANYTWFARVTNDTTATLRITLEFKFLDENDAVVRSETKSVLIAPAASKRVTGTGTFVWDDANRVVASVAEYEYEIIS